MDYQLQGKIAIVTGGSHGLGKEICLELAAEGVRVAVNYYKDDAKGIDLGDKAQGVLDEMRETYGMEGMIFPADVSNEDQVLAMFEAIDGTLGRPDILINNAAVAPTCWIRDMPLELWSSTIATNLTGTFLCCRSMIQRLFEDDRKGKIVNIASQAAFKGSNSGKAPYDASKAAVVTLTISLAREMAVNGTTVNAVAPGLIYTEMVKDAIDADPEKFLSRIPLRRIAQPEDIAKVVLFLCSHGSDYMTGATVDVTGGILMR